MWIVGWALLAVLAVCLAAVVLPVRIRLSVSTVPWAASVRVAALGGVTPFLSVYDSLKPRKTAKPPEPGTTPRQKGKRRRNRRRPGRARAGAALRHAPALLAGLFRAFRVTRLEATGSFGLDDPADTGRVFGLLAPLRYGLPPREGVRIDLQPDFASPGLDARVMAEISVSPAALLVPVARYLWRVFRPVAA